MKIRTGHVSNSSSASFIINWKIDHNNRPNNIIHAMAFTLDIYHYYVGNKSFYTTKSPSYANDSFWYEYNPISEKDFKYYIKHTKYNTITGKATSEFFTSMFNDFTSFGDRVSRFFFILSNHKAITVEKYNILKDGDVFL